MEHKYITRERHKFGSYEFSNIVKSTTYMETTKRFHKKIRYNIRLKKSLGDDFKLQIN